MVAAAAFSRELSWRRCMVHGVDVVVTKTPAPLRTTMSTSACSSPQLSPRSTRSRLGPRPRAFGSSARRGFRFEVSRLCCCIPSQSVENRARQRGRPGCGNLSTDEVSCHFGRQTLSQARSLYTFYSTAHHPPSSEPEVSAAFSTQKRECKSTEAKSSHRRVVGRVVDRKLFLPDSLTECGYRLQILSHKSH